MKDKITKDIQLSYLWKKIILLAFNPSGDKDVNKWISCYSRSVVKFWEISDYPRLDRNNLIVANGNIPINFDFSYESLMKFVVSFYYTNSSNIDFIWLHDVDKNYYIPEQPILTNDNHMKKCIKGINTDDILTILNGLFFHPTAHQHIEAPISHHVIRIGGGIHNPFQFLFHLRYQLCLIEQKRDEEKNRLTELFFNAIKSKSSIITPSDLLNI